MHWSNCQRRLRALGPDTGEGDHTGGAGDSARHRRKNCVLPTLPHLIFLALGSSVDTDWATYNSILSFYPEESRAHRLRVWCHKAASTSQAVSCCFRQKLQVCLPTALLSFA